MRRLTPGAAAPGLRTRRWDVIVLGGALPGLLAAIRIAQARLRVLVVEEESATRRFVGLREPFLLSGARAGGLLDACLRELAVPLIERRRIEPQTLAFQLVLPEARIDVGLPSLTVSELVAWKLAQPDAAQSLVEKLVLASEAELAALHAAPIVREQSLRARARAVAAGRPRPARDARPEGAERELGTIAAPMLRALSRLAEQEPPPRARARLLGAALEGGAAFADPPEHSLQALLRRRLEALQGELRTLDQRFELVSLGGEAGILPQHAGEAWLARALVLNAPLRGLEAALPPGAQAPGFLAGPPASHRRLAIHLSMEASALPEGMARRVVLVADPSQPARGANVVTVAVHPRPDPTTGTAGVVDLVASAVVRDTPAEKASAGQEIERALAALLPFSESRRQCETQPQPRWDDDDALSDPVPGRAWPAGDVHIRLSSRPPVYALPREALAALGFEGDLLLGWRGGDAIRGLLG